MKKQFPLILVIPVAIVFLLILDGFYILNEGQQAIVTQFGAPIGDPRKEAGLKLKVPFIQKVTLFDKRILIWDGQPNEIPTNDKTYIYMDNTARWRISDPLRFLQAVGTEERASILLNDIIAGTVRDLVNKHNLIEIIRSSDWSPEQMSAEIQSDDLLVPPKVGRDKVSQMILDSASKVTPQYGIELIDVMFRRVNYIESVRLRVYDRMISERKRIAAEKRSTGEGLKAEILGRVERELKEITSKASREAMEIRGKADAEAARIYAEAYNSNVEFYGFQKRIETYQNIISNNTSLVLSLNSDLFQYLEDSRSAKDRR